MNLKNKYTRDVKIIFDCKMRKDRDREDSTTDIGQELTDDNTDDG